MFYIGYKNINVKIKRQNKRVRTQGVRTQLAKNRNFDRNRVRGCNFGSDGGAVLNLGGCNFGSEGVQYPLVLHSGFYAVTGACYSLWELS